MSAGQRRGARRICHAFRIRPKYCFPSCPAAGDADCHVASLLAMTVGGRPLHPLTPGKFLRTLRTKRPCTRAHASSFSMSLRTSAHTGAAIRFPRRETWQTGTTLGKFVVLFRICPRRCFLQCCAAGEADCHVASLLAMTCRNLPPVRACNYALPAKPAAAYEFA